MEREHLERFASGVSRTTSSGSDTCTEGEGAPALLYIKVSEEGSYSSHFESVKPEGREGDGAAEDDQEESRNNECGEEGDEDEKVTAQTRRVPAREDAPVQISWHMCTCAC